MQLLLWGSGTWELALKECTSQPTRGLTSTLASPTLMTWSVSLVCGLITHTCMCNVCSTSTHDQYYPTGNPASPLLSKFDTWSRLLWSCLSRWSRGWIEHISNTLGYTCSNWMFGSNSVTHFLFMKCYVHTGIYIFIYFALILSIVLPTRLSSMCL